jgi:Uma2 family endonuclease
MPVPATSPIQDLRARASIVPITTDQYHLMIERGIVPEDSTVELLRGMLVRKDRGAPGEVPTRHSPFHRLVVALLTQLAARINDDFQHLQIQLPISCPPDSEPEPDGAIIRGAPREYADHLPGPRDVTSVIEVAHSSLDSDRSDKLQIFAGAGIPQYVLINIPDRRIEVRSEPDAAREEYRKTVVLGENDTLALLCPRGEIPVAVRELLP